MLPGEGIGKSGLVGAAGSGDFEGESGDEAANDGLLTTPIIPLSCPKPQSLTLLVDPAR